ncbi:MAG: hypothetical protein ACRCZ1_01560 [Cetobacterium sp.]
MIIYKKSLAMELIANGHDLVGIKNNPKLEGMMVYMFKDTERLVDELSKKGINNIVVVKDIDLVIELIKECIVPFRAENGVYYYNNTEALKNKIE